MRILALVGVAALGASAILATTMSAVAQQTLPELPTTTRDADPNAGANAFSFVQTPLAEVTPSLGETTRPIIEIPLTIKPRTPAPALPSSALPGALEPTTAVPNTAAPIGSGVAPQQSARRIGQAA
ncbi:MAG: hypothetical protein KDA41_02215, partial [Planctomycetales bacterium]|nr:hypothetical protein [Planctomycetales bacterium]